MARDPFDISDVSDLPESLRPQSRGNAGRVEELLKQAGGPITIKQMRVALYRLYGEKRSTESVASSLRNLAETGRAERVAGGTYRATGAA